MCPTHQRPHLQDRTTRSTFPLRPFAAHVVTCEMDYFICTVSNNGHYIPSPGLIDSETFIHLNKLSIYDPLFKLEDDQYVLTQCSISSSLVQSVITGSFASAPYHRPCPHQR